MEAGVEPSNSDSWVNLVWNGYMEGGLNLLRAIFGATAAVGGGNKQEIYKRRTIKKHRYRRRTSRTGKTRKARTDKKLRVNKSKQRTNKKKRGFIKRTNKKEELS